LGFLTMPFRSVLTSACMCQYSVSIRSTIVTIPKHDTIPVLYVRVKLYCWKRGMLFYGEHSCLEGTSVVPRTTYTGRCEEDVRGWGRSLREHLNLFGNTEIFQTVRRYRRNFRIITLKREHEIDEEFEDKVFATDVPKPRRFNNPQVYGTQTDSKGVIDDR
jgi:hypothetical protein